MYNVLITNDDGIEARGIEELISSLSIIANIYLFAPKVQQSAKGQSMTALHSFSVERRQVEGTVEAWAVDGTPADCVKWGVQSVRERGIHIDYVISGINMGVNLGADVHYSGTVSAAMEGALCGYHSIALSVEHHVPDHYAYICSMLPELLEIAAEQDISTVLNVNCPDLPAWKVKGTKITKCGPKRFLDYLVVEEPEIEEDITASDITASESDGRADEEWETPELADQFMVHYLGGNYPVDDNLGLDIDVIANREGYATITPININYTDTSAYRSLQGFSNDGTLCLFVDFQERLLPAMQDYQALLRNVVKWGRCVDTLNMPVILSQQYTKGLGATVHPLRSAFHEYSKLEKNSFSCFGTPGFAESMDAMLKRSVVICGIETHICVYQTAMDYLAHGFQVTILKDCCGARKEVDHENALRELEKAGCRITTFETFVYEAMGTSIHPAFKTISSIVKE